MSELDFGLRGLMLALPGVVRQLPKLIGMASLPEHLGTLAHLRRDLAALAQQLGFRLVALQCDDLERSLNDIRARRLRVQYGKARPAAIVPAIHGMRRALTQRWDDLFMILSQFLDAGAMAPVAAMRTEAARLDSAYTDALLAGDQAGAPSGGPQRPPNAQGRTLPKEPVNKPLMQRRTLSNALLVDDEEEICQLLSSLLKRIGCHCTFAHNLAEGRKALTDPQYDAVFLDVNLPDGLGYELIPGIKASLPTAKCIAISALDHERSRALSAGADTFIAKPFSRDHLFESLRTLGFNA